jgi:hypothetical protein
MRATFSDPEGRRIWRALPYLASALLLAAAILAPLPGIASATLAIGGVAGLNVAGLLPFRQRKRRTVELVCGPGYVDVARAGLRKQRIEARAIVGASTARTRRGVALTLVHRKRSQPLTIEVENEVEAEKIRHALGIGHGGFGTIEWRSVAAGALKTAVGGRAVALTAGALLLTVALSFGSDTALAAGVFLGQFMFLGMLLGAVGWFAKPPPPTIVMTAEGLRLLTTQGWFTVPYASVLDIEDHGRALVFRVPPPFDRVSVETNRAWAGGGLSLEERQAVIDQIRTAALRARGFGPLKEDVTGRVDVLRRNGESPRDWLVRLDMAGQMLATAPGYRGHTLDTEDLWAILEDPEADAELRAAAARVLRHQGEPEARTRIDAAVAAVRDEATNQRLRIAIRDDLDEASVELAALDAQLPAPARRAASAR